jgi:hypothetical protein
MEGKYAYTSRRKEAPQCCVDCIFISSSDALRSALRSSRGPALEVGAKPPVPHLNRDSGAQTGPGLIDAGEHNPKIGANTEIGSIPGFSIDIIPAIQLHVLLFAQAIFPVHSSRKVSRVEVGWGRMSHGIASLLLSPSQKASRIGPPLRSRS